MSARLWVKTGLVLSRSVIQILQIVLVIIYIYDDFLLNTDRKRPMILKWVLHKFFWKGSCKKIFCILVFVYSS